MNIFDRSIFRRLFASLLLTVLAATSLSAQLTLNGGNITMTVTTGAAGGQLASVTNSTNTLSYTRRTVIAKITVQTSCPNQRFGLAVVATSATGGTPQPSVTLTNGMAAVDLITSIPPSGANTKTANLRYTASATFAQGTSTEVGSDLHTVTYTYLAQ